MSLLGKSAFHNKIRFKDKGKRQELKIGHIMRANWNQWIVSSNGNLQQT